MPKSALFSSLRPGEQRVTASLLAVFQRIDFALVERILALAAGDAALELLRFVNPPAKTRTGGPDAELSASFRYLFAVKTAPAARDLARQIKDHLAQLDGRHHDERVFVLTPDPVQPAAVREANDLRVVWFNFMALDQAIGAVVADPSEFVSEPERFLLRELQALLAEDGLLEHWDVVVVAARQAYDLYLKCGLYVCQPGRSFRAGVARMGFYKDGAIQPEVPLITGRWDNVTLSRAALPAMAAELGHQADAMGRAVTALLNEAPNLRSEVHQVFLLSPARSPETLVLQQPVQHSGRGAWTQAQRYTRSDALVRNPSSTAELESFGG